MGAIHRNKILWFADCDAYRENGVTITGNGYVRRKFGSLPKHVLAALRELQGEGKIVAREVPYITRSSYREFISLKKPETQSLSDDDQSCLSAYTDVICTQYSVASISEVSHDQVWEAANDGEETPVYTIFASQTGPITDKERDWANGVTAKLAA